MPLTRASWAERSLGHVWKWCMSTDVLQVILAYGKSAGSRISPDLVRNAGDQMSPWPSMLVKLSSQACTCQLKGQALNPFLQQYLLKAAKIDMKQGTGECLA